MSLHTELTELAKTMEARANAGGPDYTDADMDRFDAICDAYRLTENLRRDCLKVYLRFT